MKTINNLLNKERSQLLSGSQQQTDSTQEQCNLSKMDIVGLWISMGSLYGNKWTSSMGDSDVGGLWFSALGSLYPDQLSMGLRKCANNGEAWPPSAPEFKAMCRPDPKDYGLPDPESAYLEACNNSHRVSTHKWTHNAIYQAGCEAKFYNIRRGGSPEQVKMTRRLFIGAYQRACEAVIAGEVMNGPVSVENGLEHHERGEKINTKKNQSAKEAFINAMRGNGL